MKQKFNKQQMYKDFLILNNNLLNVFISSMKYHA